MAAHPRLDAETAEVVEFLRRHARAELEVAVQALTEPDDDTYLAALERARAFYATGTSLGPRGVRTARPGGRSEVPGEEVRDTLAELVVYAVAWSADGWVGLLSSTRDPEQFFVFEALLLRAAGEGLRIVGRAEWDTLEDGLSFVHAGGEAFDVAAVRDPVVLAEPAAPEHAALVRRWAR